jgi:putative redox protein
VTEATVTLVNGMQFMAETETGHAFIVDGALEAGGRNTGPRPMELMAVSVVACTAMDVISILRKMQQKVTGLTVHVDGDRAEDHPKRFLSLHVEFTVTGYNLAPDRVARAIELSETKYCSAIATLRPGTPITTSFTILEADEQKLTK